MANLVLLCRRHHRLVHEGGWRLAWEEHGELVAIPPWPASDRLLGAMEWLGHIPQ
jgi:hypothetical protein